MVSDIQMPGLQFANCNEIDLWSNLQRRMENSTA